MQRLQRTFFQVRNLHQSFPVGCLLLIARNPLKKSVPEHTGKELAQDCQRRGTDCLVIILTTRGRRSLMELQCDL